MHCNISLRAVTPSPRITKSISLTLKSSGFTVAWCPPTTINILGSIALILEAISLTIAS
jgi:hypothetical protein